MQPRSWIVAALLVAWAGVAQPIIILDPFLGGAVLAAGGAAALLGAATIGAGAVGAGVVGAGALGVAAVGTAAAVGKGAVGAAALGAGKVGLAKAGLAKVGLGTVLSSSSSRYGSHEQSNSYGGRTTISVSKRYRREVSGHTAAQEMLLSEAYSLDQEMPCGLRLVCELSTRGPEELARDEELILSLLFNPHSSDSMVVPYEEAALLGRTSPSGPDACAQVYHRCDLDAIQIMQILRSTV